MIIDHASFMLARSGRIAAAELRRALAEQGLKLSHAHVLGVLAARRSMSQQALVEELKVDPSVLVTLLNTLEGDGLVARRRDPADRRRHVVEISPQGTDVVAKADSVVQAAEAELFSGLNEQERATLHRLLAQVKGAEASACEE